MHTVCVYLGANHGNGTVFSDSVKVLGKELALAQISLVYGGSSLGLMGTLANTVKEHGGKVIGIITKQLVDKEKPLSILDELHIVNSMHERKHLMQQMSDMFLVMPGGLGTLEEAFDTWNAIKIGLFNKPIGFLNIMGYFDDLFTFITSCEKNGFISREHRIITKISKDAHQLLLEMRNDLSKETLVV